MNDIKEVLVCITGASGAIYADKLLRKLVELVDKVGLVLTPQGAEIAAQELGWAMDFDSLEMTGPPAELVEKIHLFHPDDLFSHHSSGSAAPDATIVAPCTMGTAAYLAAGVGDNLITRVAAVTLKERRPLVLVIREAPLSLIDLRNLNQLAEAGAIIMPASPSFYFGPETIEDLVDYFCLRVLDQIGIRIDDPRRWSA